MNPWLDSLSEDWISQPRSSDSSQRAPSSAHSKSSAVVHQSSPSRIPRPVRKTPSSPASPRKSPDRPARSRHDVPDSAGVLGPRAFSKGNRVPVLPPRDKDTSSSDVQDENRGRPPSYGTVCSSTPHSSSQLLGTVQQNKARSASPKDRPRHGTPEWKRRLLGPDAAFRAPPDLFGPSDLERIFQPPPPSPTKSRKQLPLSCFNSDMPSSPPTFSTLAGPQHKQRRQSDDLRARSPRNDLPGARKRSQTSDSYAARPAVPARGSSASTNTTYLRTARGASGGKGTHRQRRPRLAQRGHFACHPGAPRHRERPCRVQRARPVAASAAPRAVNRRLPAVGSSVAQLQRQEHGTPAPGRGGAQEAQAGHSLRVGQQHSGLCRQGRLCQHAAWRLRE